MRLRVTQSRGRSRAASCRGDFPGEQPTVADAAVGITINVPLSLAFNSSKRSWDFSRAFLLYSFLGGGLGFGAPKPALSFVCRFVGNGCCSAVTVVSARSALYILWHRCDGVMSCCSLLLSGCFDRMDALPCKA